MRKNSRQLERYCKGVANYRRIEILDLLNDHPDKSLDEIAKILKGNMKTISTHTHRLVNAGLLRKKRRGMEVSHSLSPYGKKFLKFLGNLE